MLIRRAVFANVRSFLDRTEFEINGPISIIVGPNGGGKTNILDIIVIFLKRYLYSPMRISVAPTPEEPDRYQVQPNDVLTQLTLEKHYLGQNLQQYVELEIEITETDLKNIRQIKASAEDTHEKFGRKYFNSNINRAVNWNLDGLLPGIRFKYFLVDGQFRFENDDKRANVFLEYLRIFELYNYIRADSENESLSTPILYLPTTRSHQAITPSIQLSGFNEHDVKRIFDATTSRSGNQTTQLAIGRLAQKYRLLLEMDNGAARVNFKSDPNILKMTEILNRLGYGWNLETRNALRNEYDLSLDKQGTRFLVGNASSGEREILTYLLAIFALNVRDALVIIDEPELHLHPNWQKTLLGLFSELSELTGNQFLMATHSPTFISPESIYFVSRVYSRQQKSHVIRLSTGQLPSDKHLLQIVNSQNNERIFFADTVVLVEGVSDRVFFEAILKHRTKTRTISRIVEIVDVGGKHFFEAYKKLLDAFQINFFIIADLDYIEQIGDASIKSLFGTNNSEIKSDVIDNVKSLDALTLVAKIDTAIATGSWEGAHQIWEYIKSRRKMLSPGVNIEASVTLKNFIEQKAKEGIYVLQSGSIEAYLPEGYKSKDLQKLIEFVSHAHFWDDIQENLRKELREIMDSILTNVE